MRTKRSTNRSVVVPSIIAIIIALASIGISVCTIYSDANSALDPNANTSTLMPKSSSHEAYPAPDGWTRLALDGRRLLPMSVTDIGNNPFDSSAYMVTVDRIIGEAPYRPSYSGSDGDQIVTVGDEYVIALDDEQFTTLETENHLCVDSLVLVLMPGTDPSDQLMNECNETQAVAMTVVISQVL